MLQILSRLDTAQEKKNRISVVFSLNIPGRENHKAVLLVIFLPLPSVSRVLIKALLTVHNWVHTAVGDSKQEESTLNFSVNFLGRVSANIYPILIQFFSKRNTGKTTSLDSACYASVWVERRITCNCTLLCCGSILDLVFYQNKRQLPFSFENLLKTRTPPPQSKRKTWFPTDKMR